MHAFVSEAAAPLLEHLPALNRVWRVPRTHGRAQFKKNWPVIRALRAERFDCSVEFGGNDRGAILSFLCGARERIGFENAGGFWGRHLYFTRQTAPAPPDRHEWLRLFAVLSALEIAPSPVPETTIYSDPTLDAVVAKTPFAEAIICHMGAGMAKKQWPVAHWAAFKKMADAAGWRLVFTPGQNQREQELASELKKLSPATQFLPPLDTANLLAVMKRARVLVAGDTGPMHFAVGLGVPLVALFGPTSAARWGPLGLKQQVISAGPCACNVNSHVCHHAQHCLAAISPAQVFAAVENLLPPG